MVAAFGDELASAGVLAAALLDELEQHTAAAAEIGTSLFQRWAALVVPV